MSDSYFFCNLSNEIISQNEFIDKLNQYSNKNKKQIYVINKALNTNNYYSYENCCVIMSSYCKILVINLGDQENDEFDDYYDDFIEDLGYLSDKFGYKEVLGRPREWKGFLEKVDGNEINDVDIFTMYKISNQEDNRKIELLISLLTGSINDVNKIKGPFPITLLDKVKKKIVLYDTIQSQFIYMNNINKSVIRIQGLAGTGKTELLLHKIREKYVDEKNSRIVFTCYNKVLEEDMRKRIPDFFNFMKVEEQIEWGNRLWVMRAWGSQYNSISGVYAFICHEYGIPFQSFNVETSFDNVCKDALKLLEEKEVTPCFDYIFIDESQDFCDNFFKLCSQVTKKQVFIAGDIFQNIFDTNISSVEADYILNKCYRTDPKTLMLAHAIGMGLYEKPLIRWLEDKEWETCGYHVETDDEHYILSRDPIRRFEDLPSEKNTVFLKAVDKKDILNEIVKCINEIKDENPAVLPDDIAVIFLQSNMKRNCEIANALTKLLFEKFTWTTDKGYETKERQTNSLFISNINNIKGLEFPFVICVEENYIGHDIRTRNSIYMALTRSFISSYFIINNNNNEFVKIYEAANDSIIHKKAIIISKPTEKEIQDSKENIARITRPIDRTEIYNRAFDDYHIEDDEIKKGLKEIFKNKEMDTNISNENFYTMLVKTLKVIDQNNNEL